MYNMSTVSTFEPDVDRCISLFVDRIREINNSGREKNEARETAPVAIDASAWLEYFAFDALGELNFSRRLGFLSRGEDVGRWIGDTDKMMDYVSLVSRVALFPWSVFVN